MKVKVIFKETLNGYTFGVATCPYCGYENDGILHNNSRYPSLMDDVCIHFDHLTKDRKEVVFKERRASASVMIDPFSRY